MTVKLMASGVLVLGAGLLLGTTSCRVELAATTPRRFVAADETVQQPWISGQAIAIDGLYGDVDVIEGTSDVVEVTFTPFHYWDPDEEEEARQMLRDSLEKTVTPTDDGEIRIYTGRSGGSNGIGADITVRLPANFDGVLRVANRSDGPINPGNVSVRFVGEASSVSVSTRSLGDCSVTGAASVTRTTADCDGKVEISGVTDDVTIGSSGLETGSSVELTLAAISETATGGSIEAEDGDVNLTFPASGNFAILAVTQDGVVDPGSLPEGCSLQEADARSKTVTCGEGGAQYHVNACTDGVGECNIRLGYR